MGCVLAAIAIWQIVKAHRTVAPFATLNRMTDPSTVASPAAKDRQAFRGRTLFFWAAGALVAGLLARLVGMVPSYELQSVAVLVSTLAVVAALVLALIAGVFSIVGLVGPVSAVARRAAMTGLIGAICVFALGPVLMFAVNAAANLVYV